MGLDQLSDTVRVNIWHLETAYYYDDNGSAVKKGFYFERVPKSLKTLQTKHGKNNHRRYDGADPADAHINLKKYDE
jgi:hypothetical protein